MAKFITKRKILILLAIIFIISLIYYVLPVSLPLIAAFITALFLEPLVKVLQKHLKLKRRLSVLLTFIIFILLISLFGYFITTKVITEVIKTVENAPQYINGITRAWIKVQENMVNVTKDLPTVIVKQINLQMEQFLQNFRDSLLSYVNIDNIKRILTNIPNYLVSFIVYLVALFLFLLELPGITNMHYQYFTEKTETKVKFMSSRLSFVVSGYLKGQFLISMIVSIISLIVLLLITPNIALGMALFIWVADFIPIFGALTVFIPWALFHLITGNMEIGLPLTFLAISLLFVKRAVKEKLMGSRVGLSPLSTIVGMYLGFKLLGLIGMIGGPLVLIIIKSASEAGIIKINFKI